MASDKWMLFVPWGDYVGRLDLIEDVDFAKELRWRVISFIQAPYNSTRWVSSLRCIQRFLLVTSSRGEIYWIQYFLLRSRATMSRAFSPLHVCLCTVCWCLHFFAYLLELFVMRLFFSFKDMCTYLIAILIAFTAHSAMKKYLSLSLYINPVQTNTDIMSIWSHLNVCPLLKLAYNEQRL